MKLFVGIDQSINSTGMTIQIYDDNIKVDEHFYIITGGNKSNKLTTRESKAQTSYNNFDYVLYNKQVPNSNTNNHEKELLKTYNLVNITNNILSIINLYINKYNIESFYLCMEGVSYGSANTNSIIELSGLNYLIRYRILKNYNFAKLIVAPPSEIKKFATGNGSAKKDAMVKLFESIYPNLYLIPKIDDISDSYWMCCYAKELNSADIGCTISE